MKLYYNRLMSHLGTHPYSNIISGNQPHLLTSPNSATPGSMPIQLAANTQARAMGIPACIDQANSFSKVNFMPSMQRFSPEEMQNKGSTNRIPARSASPRPNAALSSPYGKRSSSTELPPISPDSRKKFFTSPLKSPNDTHQGLISNFVICPDVSQQVPCSPESRGSPESFYTQYDDSVRAFSPSSPSSSSEIYANVSSASNPFISSSVKCEPLLPTSPNSENGESVWRPW